MSTNGDGAGDGVGEGDVCDVKDKRSSGNGGGGDADRGKCIAWRHVRDWRRSDLARSAAAAMTELRVEWSGHDFDASMPDEECRAIFERLPPASSPSVAAVVRDATR
jgi:hypothetical protein